MSMETRPTMGTRRPLISMGSLRAPCAGNHPVARRHHAEDGIAIRHPVSPIADRLALRAGAGGNELALEGHDRTQVMVGGELAGKGEAP